MIVALLALGSSCNSAGNGNNATTGKPGETTERAAPQGSKGGAANNSWEKLTMRQFLDNNGKLIAESPYPSGWEINAHPKQGEPAITGPNGVKIMDQPMQSYLYTNDPRMQQLYAQNGQKVRPWQGAEQMVQQDFVPALRSQGWSFVRQYDVPEVAKIDKWYNDQLYKAVPMQTQTLAVGTEWQKSDGSMAFMITHVQVSNTATLQTWYYFSSVLKADKAVFERARKQYIFSLANTRYALEPIMAYNQQEAQKAGQSWAAFNSRMAQNQANFEQQQRNFVNKSNAINDAIMEGYHQRDAASDKQQKEFVDVINEKTNTVDPSTGKKYKVNSFYNQYWMNKDGEYISTNQNDYNPNLDDNMNNQKWEHLKEIK